MKQARQRPIKGSLREVPRAGGNFDWEFRFTDSATGTNGSEYFSSRKFPTREQMEQRLNFIREQLNGENAGAVIARPTVCLLLDAFIAEERLEEIKARRPGERVSDENLLAYSTASSYLSLCEAVRVQWGAGCLTTFRFLRFKTG